MPNLAVVIVNYNTRDLLAQCLRSLYANRTVDPFHVIVVDNLSTDGSAEMVRADFPEATLIGSDRNGGFGHANNLGLRWLASQSSLPSAGGRHSGSGPKAGEQPAREIPERGDSPSVL